MSHTPEQMHALTAQLASMMYGFAKTAEPGTTLRSRFSIWCSACQCYHEGEAVELATDEKMDGSEGPRTDSGS